MSEPTNVVQALAAVMGELPAIGKDGKNEDQNYSFRGIEHITAAAQKLCAKHQVVFVPKVTDWSEKDITINSKPWTDQRLCVTYRIYGPGGVEDFIEADVVGIGRDNSDKGANKGMSQAFKYALLQVLCIADPKDDGDQSTHVTDAREAPSAPPWWQEKGWASEEEHDALRRRVGEEGPLYGDAFKGWWAARKYKWPISVTAKGPIEEKLAELATAVVFPDAEVVG